MDGLTKTGTLIFGIAIGILGIIHFILAAQIASGLPSYFFAPFFWIYLSGLALLAASISIITKKYTRLACLLLALLFIILALAVDLPNLFNQQTYSAVANLSKDIALAGGALVIASASSRPEQL